MIDLKTIPLKDVPAGGFFIANKYDVCMDCWLNTFDVYVKGIGIRDFTILDEPRVGTYHGLPDSQVAYTGIIIGE